MFSTFKLIIQPLNAADPLGDKWRSRSAGNGIPVRRTSCMRNNNKEKNAYINTHTHTTEMTIDRINMRALPPVNVGVQQDSRVCGQFGQMDHFGLLLDTLTFVYPHIWQSDTHTDTHTLVTIRTLCVIFQSTSTCSGWCCGASSPAWVMADVEQEHLHVFRGPV